jgi:hypothetical protein
MRNKVVGTRIRISRGRRHHSRVMIQHNMPRDYLAYRSLVVSVRQSQSRKGSPLESGSTVQHRFCQFTFFSCFLQILPISIGNDALSSSPRLSLSTNGQLPTSAPADLCLLLRNLILNTTRIRPIIKYPLLTPTRLTPSLGSSKFGLVNKFPLTFDIHPLLFIYFIRICSQFNLVA